VAVTTRRFCLLRRGYRVDGAFLAKCVRAPRGDGGRVKACHSLGLRATSWLKDRFIHAQQNLYQTRAKAAALPELRTNYAAARKNFAITKAVRPLYF